MVSLSEGFDNDQLKKSRFNFRCLMEFIRKIKNILWYTTPINVTFLSSSNISKRF